MIDEISKYVNRPVKLMSYTRGDIDFMIDNGVVNQTQAISRIVLLLIG